MFIQYLVKVIRDILTIVHTIFSESYPNTFRRHFILNSLLEVMLTK